MRIRKLVMVALLCAMSAVAGAQESFDQPWRPQYHFTPVKNFMNDPNGMVFYQGEYHLFYQYNPEGQVWGHMSWGHAVSPDMVHWQHLPLAIPEDPNYMIYSGAAVVDWNNSSGLCRNPDPKDQSCLIAIYAADYHQKKEKTHIAYSNDRGRTWTNYAGNPVIDVDAEDFRDPYVFWYPAQKKWVLVAVLADHRKAVFFSSPDLKKWTKMSEFGPAGDDAGQWECPLLLELPIEGTKDTRWVLVINRNPGAPAGGTGVRYLVGNFDGTQFVEKESAGQNLWADYGKDFYATNTFNNMPDKRRVWMGWTSNWLYAKDEPTVLWRGAQSIPKTLALRWMKATLMPNKGISGPPKNSPTMSDRQLLMVQTPVRELQSLREKPLVVKNASFAMANQKLAPAKGDTYEIESELEPDGTKSGEVSSSKDFPGRFTTTLSDTKRVKLHIFVDRSSVEVFANDGEKVMTNRIYPPPGSTGVEVYGAGKVVSLTMWPLKSVWGGEK
jgi:fructan beta-fructosidase